MKIRKKYICLSIILLFTFLLQSCSLFNRVSDNSTEASSLPMTSSDASDTTSIDVSTDEPTTVSEVTSTTEDTMPTVTSPSAETSESTSVSESESTTSSEPGTSVSLFYVRDAWDKPETQSGAFADYENAVKQADASGQSVYDVEGNLLYEANDVPDPTPTQPSPTTTTATTQAPTMSATPTVPPTTAKPTVAPTTTAKPTVAPTTTTTQAPTTVPTQVGNYENLSNVSEGWYYTAGSPAYADVPASIDSRRAAVLAKYNAIWQLPTERKVVYLTMDEGYEYGSNTTEILNVARDKNVKITFFVTGHYVDSQANIVKRMVNEGHQVANHTDKHLVQPDALNTSVATLQNDIINVNTKFRNLTGRNLAPYMRPPTGAWSERSLAVVKDMGYRTVFWSFAYRDWEVDNQPSQDAAYNMIMSQLYPGSILLIHAVSTTNTQILGRVIDGIRARGYSIEPLP